MVETRQGVNPGHRRYRRGPEGAPVEQALTPWTVVPNGVARLNDDRVRFENARVATAAIEEAGLVGSVRDSLGHGPPSGLSCLKCVAKKCTFGIFPC